MNSPQMVPAGIKKISSEMILALVILVAVSIVLTSLDSGRQALLFLTGAALGFVLYYADFGFTGAFGAFIKERATAGFRAILVRFCQVHSQARSPLRARARPVARPTPSPSPWVR
mgnify:CR=1 FL=1